MLSPSPQQQAIFNMIAEGKRNILVSACPGSGKTTTIMHSFGYIPKDEDSLVATSIAYLVFNKRNAEEASAKVPRGVNVSTFHSLGFRALRASGLIPPKVKIEGRKVMRLVYNAMDRDDADVASVIKLVSLLKGQCEKNPEVGLARELAVRFDLDIVDLRRATQVAVAVLEASNRKFDEIDFDDMLYMPVVFNVAFATYDWVFVDEAQDTNDIQLSILHKITGLRSRVVAVGDPHQAIYGFRGANADALDKIATQFACDTLPLSVSYRCSQAVVAEAQKYE